jgi:hypothetical protein
MKPIIALLTFHFLLVVHASAQDILCFGCGLSDRNTRNPYKNQLSIAPVRLVDFVNPGLEIGYEYKHSSKLASQLSLGIMKDFLNVTPYNNYKGIRLSFEEKYFIRNTYWAAELVYLNSKFQEAAEYTIDIQRPPTSSYLDTASIQKNSIILNIKYGIQLIFGRIGIDASAGLGIKYKMTVVSDLNNTDARRVVLDNGPNSFSRTEGRMIAPTLPINIKISYCF